MLVVGWWAVLFLIGAAALPLTRRLFSSWWDQGYLLSKAVGLAGVTFITWYFGSFKLLPFSQFTILLGLGILFGIGLLTNHYDLVLRFISQRIHGKQSSIHEKTDEKDSQYDFISWKKLILLELFFFSCLWFWSYIKAFEPDIRGLEKFMDYGFARTIYNSSYFPPPDMWYAGGTINYYYFGHTMMAMLSKLSSIDLAYGYNLMLTTIFALCFTMSFSISVQLLVMSSWLQNKKVRKIWFLVVGLLGAFLVTLAGNMQTIYAFTKGYNGEDTPPPFWNILWPIDQMVEKIPQGMNSYWYANATRFIPFTIHEFPSYSFVVSDNHGHVLSIPFTLLAIASLLTLFVVWKRGKEDQQLELKNEDIRQVIPNLVPYLLYGMLGGILLMTNALDGPIYMGLFVILLLVHRSSHSFLSWRWCKEKGIKMGMAVGGAVVASLPFLLTFTSFANGLAINCPPKFMENTKIGPIIFETVDKCQKSPMWMVWLLWGFFFYCGIALIVSRIRYQISRKQIGIEINSLTKFLTIIFLYCVALIFFAEFFYFKDIYPAHFRSNTMFKLGYQAFMMCSLLCANVIITMMLGGKRHGSWATWGRRIFLVLVIPQLFLVLIFPFFSVKSYFGNLQSYKGLYGLAWFERDFPEDFQAMQWLATVGVKRHAPTVRQGGWTFLKNLAKVDNHVHDNFFTSHLVQYPVLLEADGDSYTDFDRMSAFAGMPTIVGWGVHEWLWRGSYDVVSPRKDEVAAVYEGVDPARRLEILNKYNVKFIVIGRLERQKFSRLDENAISTIGHEVFRSGTTVIYERNS